MLIKPQSNVYQTFPSHGRDIRAFTPVFACYARA